MHPNEAHPEKFREALEGKSGVYLGVGTFRTLSALGMGNFSHGVLVDSSPDVVEFNRANLELIARAGSRRAYLSALVGCPISERELESLDKGEFPDSFNKKLRKPGRYPGTQDPLQRIPSFPAEMTKAFSGFTPFFLGRNRGLFESQSQWQATIFGSDEIFSKIQSMVSRGEISVVNVDLAGVYSRGLDSVGAALRKQALAVSVIDLSNVLDQPQFPLKLGSVVTNLRGLPLASDAVVLTTHPRADPYQYGSVLFDYRVEKFSDFAKKQSLGDRALRAGLRLCGKAFGFLVR